MSQPITRIDDYENHLDAKVAKWFAIYTNYKREKLVAKELVRKGIHHYLPLQKVQRQWERKKRTVELPLISCYLFVQITKAEYIRVLETENVIKFVRFSKNLISIPDEEIDILKRIVGEGVLIEIEDRSLVEGDEVEIAQGNLTGLKGKLLSKQSTNNFVVELEGIGYSFRMSVNPELLRKTNAPKKVH